ncbi:MAG: type IX secretion system PorP/SprF family membrane protein, partial [Patiriisocius sp.]
GFEGAPMTDVLTFDMAFEGNKSMAIGGSLMHDKIGPTSELGVTASFAYRMQLARKKILSMGIQGYGGMLQANFTDLIVGSDQFDEVVTDQLISANPESVFLPNAGFGIYYHTPRMFLGLSAPRLLRSRISNDNVNGIVQINGRTEPTLFLMGGRNFEMTNFYNLQPAILVKATQGAPLSIGVSLNMLYGEIMKIGAFYNYREVIGAMFQYRISTRTRMGYSFDMSTHRLAQTNLGSHEISFAYVFRDLRRRIVYPRKF